MNVITVRDSDFLRPNSPENKKNIAKQIKLIRELYSVFPLAVVAGGTCTNHLTGVPARDIDIFVTSEAEGEQIVQYLTAGLTEEQSRIEFFDVSKMGAEAEGPYAGNFNTCCWKFFGKSNVKRNTGLFEVNVIVRKVPAETVILHRIQLLPLLWLTFPISRLATAYVDHDGLSIYVATIGNNAGTPESVAKYFRKSLLTALAMHQTVGKSNRITRNTVPSIYDSFAYADVRPHNLYQEYVPFLFTDTPYNINRMYRRRYKVSARDNILVQSHDLHEVQGWGRAMSEEDLASVITGERNYQDVHQEVADKAAKYCAGLSSEKKSFLSNLPLYREYKNSGVGSRSQDWLNTWGITSAVQPSGGTDTVVGSAPSLSWVNNPFSGTNVVQRNISLADLERIRASMDSRTPTFTTNAGVAPSIARPVPTPSSITFATTYYGGPVDPRTIGTS